MPRPTLAQLQTKPSIVPGIQADAEDLLGLMLAGVNPDGTPLADLPPVREGAALSGTAYKASTGRLTLTAAGNINATIANPAGSGKRLLVDRLTGFATGAGWARLLVNPTAGLPVAARTVNNAFVGHPTAAAAAMAAEVNLTTALSGGTDPGLTIGIPNGTRWLVELEPLIVPAGVTLGITIPFAGAADAVMTAYWREAAA